MKWKEKEWFSQGFEFGFCGMFAVHLFQPQEGACFQSIAFEQPHCSIHHHRWSCLFCSQSPRPEHPVTITSAKKYLFHFFWDYVISSPSKSPLAPLVRSSAQIRGLLSRPCTCLWSFQTSRNYLCMPKDHSPGSKDIEMSLEPNCMQNLSGALSHCKNYLKSTSALKKIFLTDVIVRLRLLRTVLGPSLYPVWPHPAVVTTLEHRDFYQNKKVESPCSSWLQK